MEESRQKNTLTPNMDGSKPNLFRCKQFNIRHDTASLKVTTEALILGAYVASKSIQANSILDIGTGTGLLSLMIAQQTFANIDAVEIEPKAFLLAKENIANSLFSAKINLHHTEIQLFESDLKYDLILSNPPFYSNHLKAKNLERNSAIHDDLLPFIDLGKAVKKFLKEGGKFFVLLPPYQLSLFEKEILTQNLKKTYEFKIHHSQNSKVLRIIATFEYNLNTFISEDFFIKDENQNYTKQFIKLLKDYYLIF